MEEGTLYKEKRYYAYARHAAKKGGADMKVLWGVWINPSLLSGLIYSGDKH